MASFGLASATWVGENIELLWWLLFNFCLNLMLSVLSSGRQLRPASRWILRQPIKCQLKSKTDWLMLLSEFQTGFKPVEPVVCVKATLNYYSLWKRFSVSMWYYSQLPLNGHLVLVPAVLSHFTATIRRTTDTSETVDGHLRSALCSKKYLKIIDI